jgi:hypothetical protein
MTDATMRFMAPHGWWQRLWRNLTLRGSTRFAALRRRVNSGRLAEPFVYAGSPIVEHGPEDPTLPRHGSVAPDLRLSSGARLKDRFGSMFVVLIAGAPAELSARAARLRLPMPSRIVDDPALAPVYAPAGPRAWVIRPDGHIASSLSLGGPSGGLAADDALDQLAGLVSRAAGR